MRTDPTTITKLLQAIHRVRRSLPPVPKLTQNHDTGTFYATLDQIQEALDPGLMTEQLVILPDYRLMDGVLETTLTVYHVPSQQSFAAHFPIPLQGAITMSTGAAATYARRMLLCSLFNLRTPDTNGQSGPGCAGEPAAAGTAGPVQPPVGGQDVPTTTGPGRTPEVNQGRIQAMRSLIAAWIEASTRLGVQEAARILESEIGTREVRHIPPHRILEATTHLNLAVRQAECQVPRGQASSRVTGAGVPGIPGAMDHAEQSVDVGLSDLPAAS